MRRQQPDRLLNDVLAEPVLSQLAGEACEQRDLLAFLLGLLLHRGALRDPPFALLDSGLGDGRVPHSALLDQFQLRERLIDALRFDAVSLRESDHDAGRLLLRSDRLGVG